MSSIINKKTEQTAIDGAIQTGIVLGEMWIAKELGVMKKSTGVKAISLGATIIVSRFVCDWMEKQTWYPKV